MMDIEECMNNLSDKALDHNLALKELLLCFREGEYMKLLEKGENSLRYTVELYRLYRELLLSLYDVMPSVPQSENAYKFCWDLLGISVERSKEFDFPFIKSPCQFCFPTSGRERLSATALLPSPSASLSVSFAPIIILRLLIVRRLFSCRIIRMAVLLSIMIT